MVKGYLIVKVSNNGVEEVIDTFNELIQAEHELSKLYEEYKNEIIGYDDDYFTIEDDYGNIITYQIIPIYKKDEEKLKNFEIPIDFSYYVKVSRKAKIQAKTKEEALEILEKELEEGADPTDYEYIEENWEYNDYTIFEDQVKEMSEKK